MVMVVVHWRDENAEIRDLNVEKARAPWRDDQKCRAGSSPLGTSSYAVMPY